MLCTLTIQKKFLHRGLFIHTIRIMHNRSICITKIDVVQVPLSRTFKRRFCVTTEDAQRDRLKNLLGGVSQSLGYSSIADWYKINASQIKSNLNLKKEISKSGSIINILRTAYPEQKWVPWKFEHFRCPNGFWKHVRNHRLFFDWLGNELGVKELNDWYSILSYEQMISHGGSKLLAQYNNSAIHALEAAYPDHPWCIWKFKNVHKGLWGDINNQRQFMEWMSQELGLKELDDWYKHASVATFIKYGRSGLLSIHKGSPYLLMKAVYPQHNWLAWKFDPLPKHYWSDPDHLRVFIEWASPNLNIEKLDDWYNITNEQIVLLGGQSPLRHKSYSIFRILRSVYPQHQWKPWKFQSHPKVDWSLYIPSLVEELSQQLHIHNLDDWYRVSTEQLQERSALTAIRACGGLYKVLSSLYPEHSWNQQKFSDNRKKAGQRWLFCKVQELFPHTEVYEDYRIHESSVGESRYPFELDVFVPSLSLAFEYQGQAHYYNIGMFSPRHVYQERDIKKRAYCQKHNITLIDVPYWWDKQQSTLAGLIRSLRSDVQLPPEAAIGSQLQVLQ